MNNDEILPFASPYIRPYERGPIHRLVPKMGRNDFCSIENKKFKNCCGKLGYKYCVKLYNQYLEKNIENLPSSISQEKQSSSS